MELNIGVKRGAFRASSAHIDPEYQQIRPGILKRDNYSCQAKHCGFRVMKYQETHHIDDIHQNNAPQNLITLCPLCHSVLHVGLAAQKGNTKLIYLPQISHGAWSSLLRGLWCVRQIHDVSVPLDDDMQASAKKAKDLAKSLVEVTLPAKANEACKMLGGTDLLGLANYMKECDEKEYQRLQLKLKDFRILHDPGLYEDQIKYWCKQYNWLPKEKAMKMFDMVV